MAQILNIEIPKNKRVVIGLTKLYGVGVKRAESACIATKIDPNMYVKDLSLSNIASFKDYFKQFSLEGELRRETAFHIKHLKDIGCYRGIRHKKRLPVRGQRTRCNARTRKGPRQTVANKKKASKK